MRVGAVTRSACGTVPLLVAGVLVLAATAVVMTWVASREPFQQMQRALAFACNTLSDRVTKWLYPAQPDLLALRAEIYADSSEFWQQLQQQLERAQYVQQNFPRSGSQDRVFPILLDAWVQMGEKMQRCIREQEQKEPNAEFLLQQKGYCHGFDLMRCFVLWVTTQPGFELKECALFEPVIEYHLLLAYLVGAEEGDPNAVALLQSEKEKGVVVDPSHDYDRKKGQENLCHVLLLRAAKAGEFFRRALFPEIQNTWVQRLDAAIKKAVLSQALAVWQSLDMRLAQANQDYQRRGVSQEPLETLADKIYLQCDQNAEFKQFLDQICAQVRQQCTRDTQKRFAEFLRVVPIWLQERGFPLKKIATT